MGTKQRRKPDHCYIMKCEWRGTSIKLRIEADDIEYAYQKAENMVMRMLGGAMCLGIKCIRQEY